MLFWIGNGYYYYGEEEEEEEEEGSSPPASVDCTLSLGTPSTRVHQSRSSWKLHSPRPSAAASPLLPRRCSNCNTTSTPLWRNGPRGPKSLCNACGIRFKKEERRATAAAASHGESWPQPPVPHCYSSQEFRFLTLVD